MLCRLPFFLKDFHEGQRQRELTQNHLWKPVCRETLLAGPPFASSSKLGDPCSSYCACVSDTTPPPKGCLVLIVTLAEQPTQQDTQGPVFYLSDETAAGLYATVAPFDSCFISRCG